jgi:hypothetical protein
MSKLQRRRPCKNRAHGHLLLSLCLTWATTREATLTDHLQRPIRVPAAHRKALIWLSGLADEPSNALLDKLAGLAGFSSAAKIADNLTGVAGATATNADALVRAGLSLATQTKYHGWANDDLARAVATSPDLELPAELQDAAAKRVARLISAEAVSTTARALDLQGEHERIFHDARVLTDIRPVFGPDATAPPIGAVINETLKIEYFTAADTKEVFIALDRDDLIRLKSVVDRAITKAESLQAFLEAADLRYYEWGVSDHADA